METENKKVSVTLGYTVNLGNFESLRVDLGVTDNVKQDESIEQAQDRVFKLVEAQLIEKVNETRAELAPK